MAKIKSEDLLQSIRESAPNILARDTNKIDDVVEFIEDAIKKLTTDYSFEHIQHDGVGNNGKKISVDELRIRQGKGFWAHSVTRIRQPFRPGPQTHQRA